MSNLVSATQLAKILGKSRGTIHNLIGKGMPRRPDKQFDTAAVVRWLESCAKENAMMATGAGDSPALERYRIARAETAEFDLQLKRDSFLLKSDVAVENATKFGIIEAGIKHLMRTRAAEYCELVGGDGKKAVNLIEAFNQDLDSVFDQFCNMKGLTGTVEVEEL